MKWGLSRDAFHDSIWAPRAHMTGFFFVLREWNKQLRNGCRMLSSQNTLWFDTHIDIFLFSYMTYKYLHPRGRNTSYCAGFGEIRPLHSPSICQAIYLLGLIFGVWVMAARDIPHLGRWRFPWRPAMLPSGLIGPYCGGIMFPDQNGPARLWITVGMIPEGRSWNFCPLRSHCNRQCFVVV